MYEDIRPLQGVLADERTLYPAGYNIPVELSGAVLVIAEYIQWVIFKLPDPYSETMNGVIRVKLPV